MSDEDDRTEDIAARLGITPTVLALVVGAPWSPAERFGRPSRAGIGDDEYYLDARRDDVRSARDGSRRPGAAGTRTDWFVAGDPVQLMIGIDDDGSAHLARPVVGWDGPGTPTLDPADVWPVPGLPGCTDPGSAGAWDVRMIRDGLLEDVRAEIGHCAVCFTLGRDLGGDRLCYACMSRWQGVVF